jgi:mercuric ion transport protein
MTAMSEDFRTGSAERVDSPTTGATLLAAGGLAAAFGAASCCALPLLLGSLGLGSAWLGGLALLAAPYRPELLVAAVLCLATGAGLYMLQRRTVAACAADGPCRRPWATAWLTGVLSLGIVLAVLGFIFG